MKRRPNGKNVEVALQLLKLSLALKSAVKKADRRKLRGLARKHFLLARLESVLQEA